MGCMVQKEQIKTETDPQKDMDRIVLRAKIQRDKLNQYIKKYEININGLTQKALAEGKLGNREIALVLLKKKKDVEI